MKIALICGGPSLERGISLNSARSLLDHIDGDGIEVVPIYYDHKKQPYAISKSQLYSNTPSDFDFKLQKTAKKLSQTGLKRTLSECDLAFPVMHGKFGEDGGVQRILEKMKIPYVGSEPEACKRCFDKYFANEYIREHGFFALPSAVLKIYHDDHEKIVRTFFKEHGVKRAVVKPATGGSSIGVFSVESPEEALEAVQTLFSKRMDTRVVLEPFCTGIEFTVIVLQNKFGMPVAVLPTEIETDYTANQVFDYRKKYLPSNQVRYHCPPRFDNATVERIQVQAEQLFEVLGMRDFARFDGWLLPDGNLWFSDFNPISGMEQNSFLFQQASRIGLSHRDLLRHIVGGAARRHGMELPEVKQEAKPKQPVNVVFGGATAERQVSLMSGTNAWLKLRRSHKYEPHPYLLDLNGEVWKIPYAFALNHTVEEILENCLHATQNEARLHELVDKVKWRLSLPEEAYSEPFFMPEKMSLQDLILETKKSGAFFFSGLHGGLGENGELQGMLDKKKIPYNGPGQKASETCIDKYATGMALAGLEKEGIYSAAKLSVPLAAEMPSWDALTEHLGTKTVIVKPQDEGCSAGIVRLFNGNDFENYIRLAREGVPMIPPGTFKNQKGPVDMPLMAIQNLMFEAFVETDRVVVKGNELKWKSVSGWVEVTVGVVQRGNKMHALSPSLTVAEGEVLSVEEKFQGGTGINMTPPPESHVPAKSVKRVKKHMERVAEILGLEGYSRIDAFMELETGNVIVIEVNTTPALTPSTVLYHQALAEPKAQYPTEFLETLIENKRA